MRNLILILMAMLSVLFISCNEDDTMTEEISENSDPIIGSWQITEEFIDGQMETLTACDLKDKLFFKSEGTFSGESFIESSDGNCVPDTDESEEDVTFNWEKIEDGLYLFSTTNEDDRVIRAEVEFFDDKMSITDNFEGIAISIYKRIN